MWFLFSPRVGESTVGWSLEESFCPSWINAQEYNCWIHDSCILTFSRNCQTFPNFLHPFAFPLAMCEWSSFSTSLSVFGVVRIFYFSHSREGVEIPHYGFICIFLMANDVLVSFCVLTCHLHILSGEFSSCRCPFSIWTVFCYWVWRMLYVFQIAVLHQICCLWMFSPSL